MNKPDKRMPMELQKIYDGVCAVLLNSDAPKGFSDHPDRSLSRMEFLYDTILSLRGSLSIAYSNHNDLKAKVRELIDAKEQLDNIPDDCSRELWGELNHVYGMAESRVKEVLGNE